MKIRYIKEFINGSNANSGCHWVEIQAIDYYGVNKALNKTVTASTTPSTNNESINVITDGTVSETGYTYFPNSDNAGITVNIDLGDVYSIDEIKVWHYYVGGRQYKNMLLQVSQDNLSWTTIWDGSVSGVYAETAEGKTHKLSPEMSIVKPTETSSISDIIEYYSSFVNSIKEQKEALKIHLKTLDVSINENDSMKSLIRSMKDIKVGINAPSWMLAPGWKDIKSCTSSLYSCKAVPIKDKIYVTGADTEELFIYDTATNTWTRIDNIIARNRSKHAVVAANDMLYIIGGWSTVAAYDQDTIECYDPDLGTTTKLQNMPATASGISAETLNNNIYVFGCGSSNDRVYKYDISTNTWTDYTAMSTQRKDMGSTIIDDNICLVGGYFSGSGNNGTYNITEYFNPDTGTWTAKASMPITIFECCVENVKGTIYCFHGRGISSGSSITYITTMYCYNPNTNSWSTNGTVTKRTLSCSAVYNNILYSFGGYDGSSYYSTGRCYIQ